MHIRGTCIRAHTQILADMARREERRERDMSEREEKREREQATLVRHLAELDAETERRLLTRFVCMYTYIYEGKGEGGWGQGGGEDMQTYIERCRCQCVERERQGKREMIEDVEEGVPKRLPICMPYMSALYSCLIC